MQIVLIDTSHQGTNGSMARYAELLDHAFRIIPPGSQVVEITMLNLALPFQLPTWLPGGMAVWVNHIWILLTAGFRIRRAKPGLVHVLDGSYGYIAHFVSQVPVIATVHDLIPLLQQRGYFGPDSTSWLAHRLVKQAISGLDRCRALIADSEHTRRDLQTVAGIDPGKIEVIPMALGRHYLSSRGDDGSSKMQSRGENTPLVLHVGNNAHYKNRAGVLRVFAMIRQQCGARLVFAGAKPGKPLERLARELGVRDFIEFAGVLDDFALSCLYRRASLLLFPSLYEGFGWPPLEAMACGCPVVCSSAASLPEVVGDAALMAPASDEAELARLCVQVLQDQKLAGDLARKGRERARRFTPERMARQVLELYTQVLAIPITPSESSPIDVRA